MRTCRVSAALAAFLTASTQLAAQESVTDWLRVVALSPGQTITLTIRDAQLADRCFLSADPSRVTVLDLTDPAMPQRVTKTLRQLGSDHPEYFVRTANGGTVIDGTLRMSPDGVFFGAEKVADLARVVQVIAQPDVDEIITSRKGRGFWGHVGPLGGYFLGAMSGGMTAGLGCRGAAGSARCDSGAFMVGMVAGGVMGGLYGFAAANRETEELVYRPPSPTVK